MCLVRSVRYSSNMPIPFVHDYASAASSGTEVGGHWQPRRDEMTLIYQRFGSNSCWAKLPVPTQMNKEHQVR